MTYTPMELAQAFIQTGELDDALEALNRQLDQVPDDDTARRMRVEVLTRKNTPAHTESALQDLLAIKERIPPDFSRLASLYQRMNDTESALKALTDGRTHYPKDERLAESLVTLLVAQHRHADAHAVINQMPHDWRWRQWAGDIAMQQSDFKTAITQYTQALDALGAGKLDAMQNHWAVGIHARLLLTRASAHRKQGDLAQAEADYQQAQTLIPDDPMIPFNRGVVKALQGDKNGGKVLCENAYQQAPSALKAEMRKDVAQDDRLSNLIQED